MDIPVQHRKRVMRIFLLELGRVKLPQSQEKQWFLRLSSYLRIDLATFGQIKEEVRMMLPPKDRERLSLYDFFGNCARELQDGLAPVKIRILLTGCMRAMRTGADFTPVDLLKLPGLQIKSLPQSKPQEPAKAEALFEEASETMDDLFRLEVDEVDESNLPTIDADEDDAVSFVMESAEAAEIPVEVTASPEAFADEEPSLLAEPLPEETPKKEEEIFQEAGTEIQEETEDSRPKEALSEEGPELETVPAPVSDLIVGEMPNPKSGALSGLEYLGVKFSILLHPLVGKMRSLAQERAPSFSIVEEVEDQSPAIQVRVLAAWLDGLFLVALQFLAWPLSILASLVLPAELVGWASLLVYFLITGLMIASLAQMEGSRWQATPGKLVFGLKTVTKSGEALQFKDALRRSLIRFLPALIGVGMIPILMVLPSLSMLSFIPGLLGLGWMITWGLAVKKGSESLWDKFSSTKVIDRLLRQSKDRNQEA